MEKHIKFTTFSICSSPGFSLNGNVSLISEYPMSSGGPQKYKVTEEKVQTNIPQAIFIIAEQKTSAEQ